MKPPIDLILDQIEWEELPPWDGLETGDVYTTHEGNLRIAGADLRCYQLSDGKRVIDAEDFARFFGLV